jgi:hypothetical protein
LQTLLFSLDRRQGTPPNLAFEARAQMELRREYAPKKRALPCGVLRSLFCGMNYRRGYFFAEREARPTTAGTTTDGEKHID